MIVTQLIRGCTLEGFQRSLIYLGIFLTPVFSFAEIIALFEGQITLGAVTNLPVLKILKDLILLLIGVVGLRLVLNSRRMFFVPALGILIVMLAGSAVFTILDEKYVYAAFGLRATFTLFLILLIPVANNKNLQTQIAKLLRVMLIAALFIQILQLLFMPPFYGSIMGFSARNPGFFMIPSTMAAFSMASFYYMYFFLPDGITKRIFCFALTPVSVALTASGTGLIAYVLSVGLIAFFAIRNKGVVLFSGLLIVVFTALALPTITGREDIFISSGTRLGILLDALFDGNVFISNNFGQGTNSAVSWTNARDVPFDSTKGEVYIADSSFNFALTDVGVFATGVFLLFILTMFRKDARSSVFLAITLIFSMTTNITESFPFNLLLAVNFVFLCTSPAEKRWSAKSLNSEVALKKTEATRLTLRQ